MGCHNFRFKHVLENHVYFAEDLCLFYLVQHYVTVFLLSLAIAVRIASPVKVTH